MRSARWTYVATAAATTGAAVLGSVGTRVDSHWYQRLDKPQWQPPGWLFGPAWTILYGLTAAASGRFLNRTLKPARRQQYVAALGFNLALNTGWTWLFFTAKRFDLSLIDSAALELSTLDLLRQAARTDPIAAGMLAPYAAWVGFATTLNTALLQRNGGRTWSNPSTADT